MEGKFGVCGRGEDFLKARKSSKDNIEFLINVLPTNLTKPSRKFSSFRFNIRKI